MLLALIAVPAFAVTPAPKNSVTSKSIKNGQVKKKDIAKKAVNGSHVADDSLTGADINESTLQGLGGGGAPSGPAGGDLTGTYPNPAIADAAVTIPKLDFDPATQGELGALATAGTINQAGNPVDWTQLKGVPGGIADGDDANSGGTVTSVDSGVGLTGGPITGSGTLSLASAFRLPQACSDGQIAKWNNGTGSWDCASDNDSTVPSGPAGGDLSGSYPDPQIADDAVNSPKVAPDSLSGADIDESTFSTSPSGAAGGDLAGSTYPNPEIAPDAVGSPELAAGSVLQGKLADSAVTIPKLDFDPATQAELDAEMDNLANPGTINDTTNPVDWTKLKGVPGDVADGTDATGNDWSLAGNAGTDPNSDFLGTTDGAPLELRVNSTRALRIEPADPTPNLIGGASVNEVTPGAWGATIGGGGGSGSPPGPNRVTDTGGTVSGGGGNTAGDDDADTFDAFVATVGGGLGNTASGSISTIGGGINNIASGGSATVAGGSGNTASGTGAGPVPGSASVGGGWSNAATGTAATVPGGLMNSAGGTLSFAAGGSAQATHNGAFVWSDTAGSVPGVSPPFQFGSTATNQFSVRATGGARFVTAVDGGGAITKQCTIDTNANLSCDGSFTGTALAAPDTQPLELRVGGNRALLIQPQGGSPNLVGGASANSVAGAGVFGATIAGGGSIAEPNTVSDNGGTVGGGLANRAGDNVADVFSPTVGGGYTNTSGGNTSTVSGGSHNTASGDRATIGGGSNNVAIDQETTIGGGTGNTADGTDASVSTIGGGVDNTVSGAQSTIAGGNGNTASGEFATVGGGVQNTASGQVSTVAGGGFDNAASAQAATVGGGSGNTASGQGATVPGGTGNIASGIDSFAAGNTASAAHNGSFVWADNGSFAFGSSADNEFSVRATGGTRFVSGVDGLGNPNAGVILSPGSGSWAALSDRAAKEAVTPVSGSRILRRLARLPIAEWSYIAQGPDVRHIGPMAQDFADAFGVGEDRRHITTVDADGVALAAIKALSAKVRSQQRQIDALAAELGRRAR